GRGLIHPENLLNFWLALVRPLRLAVNEKLLQDWKSDFAVIQGIPEVADLVDPRRWDPRNRQTGEPLDMTFAAWTGIGQNGHVRLVCYVELFQHRASILATVPNGNEIKMHLGIVSHHL